MAEKGPQDLGLGVGVATHSKCFLIFSDSAYLEIPLMKRVRFTWGERSGSAFQRTRLENARRVWGTGS